MGLAPTGRLFRVLVYILTSSPTGIAWSLLFATHRYRGIAVLQRDHETETEFIPIMTFDSVRSATDFQGEDYERCYDLNVAQEVLDRWDLRSAHFEVLETRGYP